MRHPNIRLDFSNSMRALGGACFDRYKYIEEPENCLEAEDLENSRDDVDVDDVSA